MTYIPPESAKVPVDEIMAGVWQARDELVRARGGVHGLAAFLEQRQKTLPADRIRRPARQLQLPTERN
jgi:hypothetical protein